MDKHAWDAMWEDELDIGASSFERIEHAHECALHQQVCLWFNLNHFSEFNLVLRALSLYDLERIWQLITIRTPGAVNFNSRKEAVQTQLLGLRKIPKT